MQDLDWEVHLISSPEANAFVLPGGKIFVFTGILQAAHTDSALAAVLAHEMGHAIAHHFGERMSSSVLVMGLLLPISLFLGIDFGLTNIVAEVAILRPSSRIQETEADYIGMHLLSQACYNPEDAVVFWENMKLLHPERGGPRFLDTHPHPNQRIENIKRWMPEMMRVREDSDCESMDRVVGEFQRAFPFMEWRW